MSILLDQFSNSWRAWDQGRHVHSKHGYGSCAAHAPTPEEAIAKVNEMIKRSRPGLSCDQNCPEYSWDFY